MKSARIDKLVKDKVDASPFRERLLINTPLKTVSSRLGENISVFNSQKLQVARSYL